jgi:hypothetical protein
MNRDDRGEVHQEPTSRNNAGNRSDRPERGGRDAGARPHHIDRYERPDRDRDQTNDRDQDREDLDLAANENRPAAGPGDYLIPIGHQEDAPVADREDFASPGQGERTQADRETEMREDREDQEFDRELRGIQSRADEKGESVVERNASELEENRVRTQGADADAYREPARETSPALEEIRDMEAEPGKAPAEPKKPAKRGRGGVAKSKKKPASAGAGSSRRASKTPAAKATVAAPVAEPTTEGDEEAKPKRSRGKRGGRGRGKSAAGAEHSDASSPAKPAASARSDASSSRKPPVVSEPPIVRTGSADRHLADDEPVLHEPVRRPRSVRDLDHIPDDYD